MKILFVILMMLSLSGADEMTRIEAIVDDITELRADYEKCQKDLKSKGIVSKDSKYKKLYAKEKQKNVILKAELDFNSDLAKSNKLLSKRIKELEKQVKRKDKLLKTKDKALKSKTNCKEKKCKPCNKCEKCKKCKECKKAKPCPVVKPCKKAKPCPTCPKTKISKKEISSKVCDKTNTFPKLMMKEVSKTKKINSEKIITFKASSFKLLTDSIIYDGVDGKRINKWVKNTSFTSNQKTSNWIKVSGYFVDKKWTSAKKEMWIKKAQVIKK